MGKECIKCSESLDTESNWTVSRRKKCHYICKQCFNTEFKERKAYKAERKTDRRYLKLGTKLSRKVTNFIQDSVKRNKELDFSFKEISEIMQEPCSYCGSEDSYSGLDRIDSSKGYIEDNVTACCATCNKAKSTLTVQEYINHCKKVIKHWEV